MSRAFVGTYFEIYEEQIVHEETIKTWGCDNCSEERSKKSKFCDKCGEKCSNIEIIDDDFEIEDVVRGIDEDEEITMLDNVYGENDAYIFAGLSGREIDSDDLPPIMSANDVIKIFQLETEYDEEFFNKFKEKYGEDSIKMKQGIVLYWD